MGIFTVALGLVALAVALISLKRGRISAGGRLTRSKMTGKAVLYIAVPRAIVAGLAVVVGAADLLGYSAIGKYSSVMIVVLVGTSLITNLGIGGFFQAKSAIEEVRRSKESLVDPWPEDIPEFYPNLNEEELYGFMSEQRYEEICRFPIVSIYPPCNTIDDDEDMVFAAAGLSRVLIRNLMLAPNLSVRGPEDTSLLAYDHLLETPTILQDSDYLITGRLNLRDGFAVESEIFTATERLLFDVREGSLRSFILRYSGLLVSQLGGAVTNGLEEQWQYGQPESVEQLTSYGKMVHESMEHSDHNQRNDLAVLSMFQSDPRFVLPLHQLSEDAKYRRRLYLEGLRSDRFDAQLCFLLFCDIWESKRPQPEAFQFIRKAIELSPGHGKAHMCAPHAARWETGMLRHSELRYRLLPGNPFAVNNYVLNLQRAGEAPETLIGLALEGIEDDPYDPTSYDRIIETYTELEQYPEALEYALKLGELYGPPINERTLYCLNQNPARKALLASGEYDPAQENNERIGELRRRISP